MWRNSRNAPLKWFFAAQYVESRHNEVFRAEKGSNTGTRRRSPAGDSVSRWGIDRGDRGRVGHSVAAPHFAASQVTTDGTSMTTRRFLWSAPAERSGDGTLPLGSPVACGKSKSAVAAPLCRRTPYNWRADLDAKKVACLGCAPALIRWEFSLTALLK